MSTSENLYRALGVSDETLEMRRAIKEQEAQLVPPTENDVAGVVWAVDLSVADDRMTPAAFETLNGIVVPRTTQRHGDGTYTLLASRVKRGTEAITLSADEALVARARYIFWHNYYVAAYAADKLSYVEKDAARRLYWNGGEPPPEPARWLMENRMRREMASK
jgi:hypothetical protein